MQPTFTEKEEKRMACTIYLNRQGSGRDEMDLDYGLIEEKVKELNDIGIDITLQEIGDIIESKFMGHPYTADLRRWDEGERKGKLLYYQYSLLRNYNLK